MHLAHCAALALAITSVSVPVRAEPEWKLQSGKQQVFTAALYTSDYARIVIECRAPAFLVPEVTVSFVPPDLIKAGNDADLVATLSAGDESAQLPMKRLGDSAADNSYRWTGAGANAMAMLRKVAESASPSAPLVVTLPGKAPVTFRSGYENSSAMQDVVLRCAPSVVRVRNQAAIQTSIPTLLTLSADANDRCRGGGVPDVMAACAERSEYGERLSALGMCYGKRGEFGYQMQWHRCGPTSNRRS